MAQVSAGRDAVADDLFELFDLRKPSFVLTRPDDLRAKADFEYTSGARYQSDFSDFALECGQEFLCHPGSPQQPTALRTVLDLYSRTVGHHVVQFNSYFRNSNAPRQT